MAARQASPEDDDAILDAVGKWLERDVRAARARARSTTTSTPRRWWSR